MSIQESQFVGLRAFGYSEVEARFLYLVAVHSGYFTVRQFLDFAHAKSGKRNAHFVEKLFRLGHATAQRYRRRSLIYHLCSRRIYEAIGKAHLRSRREHELDYIKAKLLGLDFILANPEDRYFAFRILLLVATAEHAGTTKQRDFWQPRFYLRLEAYRCIGLSEGAYGRS